MATYSKEDFERIAVAVGKDVTDVMRCENRFEAAALWYRLNSRAPKAPTRIAPSVMSKKMKQIAKDARKLLAHLEVHDPREAPDGPGAIALLEYLASAEDSTEDDVIQATARVGRLVEILDSIDAARELERRAEKAAEDALQIGNVIVPKEHQGDVAVNDWIAAMLSVYKQITGKEPGTSVGAPGSALQRKATGPLIRFLASAEKPLGLEHSAESLRDRVRDILKSGRRRTK
jgi:flagellar hook-length control protein FliK